MRSCAKNVSAGLIATRNQKSLTDSVFLNRFSLILAERIALTSARAWLFQKVTKRLAMQKFVERMVAEATDLDGKIKKAKSAVQTPPYGMTKEKLMMLSEQIKCMEEYSYWLHERLRAEGVHNGN